VSPEALSQFTVTESSTSSVAVADQLTVAPSELVASWVMSSGRLRTGLVTSLGGVK
jgi:hypothetical protein